MTHWIDKAEKQIEDDFENGEITDKEYKEQMRDAHAEHEQEAHDAAEQAYNDVIGGW